MITIINVDTHVDLNDRHGADCTSESSIIDEGKYGIFGKVGGGKGNFFCTSGGFLCRNSN